MNMLLTTITFATIVFFQFGCNEQKFSATSSLVPPPIIEPEKVNAKARPQCEVSEIDYQLEAQVLSFDVVSDKGSHFGFSLIPGFEWFKAFDTKFRFKKSTLLVSTGMAELLKPADPFGQAVGSAEQNENSWGAEIDLNRIQIGHSSFTTSPFYSVMLEALKKSFFQTSAIVKNLEGPWNTIVVSKENEKEIIIPSGKNAGIRVGDVFEVYNVEHHWVAEPCKSAHRMATLTTENPLGIGTVKTAKDLTPNSTRLVLSETSFDTKIEEGAYVYLRSADAARTLKRSVRIKEIKPFKISWRLGHSGVDQELDVTQFLNSAVQSVSGEMGFYIKSGGAR